MSAKVVQIESRMPHFVIPCDEGHAHVVPVALVEQWISGELPPEPPCIVRQIISSWMDSLCPSEWD